MCFFRCSVAQVKGYSIHISLDLSLAPSSLHLLLVMPRVTVPPHYPIPKYPIPESIQYLLHPNNFPSPGVISPRLNRLNTFGSSASTLGALVGAVPGRITFAPAVFARLTAGRCGRCLARESTRLGGCDNRLGDGDIVSKSPTGRRIGVLGR